MTHCGTYSIYKFTPTCYTTYTADEKESDIRRGSEIRGKNIRLLQGAVCTGKNFVVQHHAQHAFSRLLT